MNLDIVYHIICYSRKFIYYFQVHKHPCFVFGEGNTKHQVSRVYDLGRVKGMDKQ